MDTTPLPVSVAVVGGLGHSGPEHLHYYAGGCCPWDDAGSRGSACRASRAGAFMEDICHAPTAHGEGSAPRTSMGTQWGGRLDRGRGRWNVVGGCVTGCDGWLAHERSGDGTRCWFRAALRGLSRAQLVARVSLSMVFCSEEAGSIAGIVE